MEKKTDQLQATVQQLGRDSISDDGTTYDSAENAGGRVSYYNVYNVPTTEGPVMSYADASGKATCPMLVYSIIVIGASMFLYGFDNNVVSSVAVSRQFAIRYQGSEPVEGMYLLSQRNSNLVNLVPYCGLVVGALCAPWFLKKFGRKWPLVCSYIFSLGGIFLEIFAPNLTAIVIGRCWCNYSSGIGAVVYPLYLAEVVPSTIRGRAVVSSNIWYVISGLLTMLVIWATGRFTGEEAHLAYRLPLACQAILTGVLLPLTSLLPDSPQWLASVDRMVDARKSLRRLRGYNDAMVDDELRMMKMIEVSQVAQQARSHFWDLFTRQNFKRTIVAGSMMSFSTLSGITLTSTYIMIYFMTSTNGSPYAFAVVTQLCILLGSIAAVFTIDRFGRRPTALIGMTIIFFIDLICGLLAFGNPDQRSSYGIAIAAFCLLFNIFWSWSFNSIINLLPVELAPTNLRAWTMAYANIWASITGIATTFIVPQIAFTDGANLGPKTLLVFAGCMLPIILFVFRLMPETNGRSLGEIDELYAQDAPIGKWTGMKTNTKAKQAKIVSSTEFARAKIVGGVQFTNAAESSVRGKIV